MVSMQSHGRYGGHAESRGGMANMQSHGAALQAYAAKKLSVRI